jgi:cell division protein FtsZ
MADQVLQQGVRGITDLMVMPGLINLDFADVRSVMSEMGKAMMGTGEAGGDNRAIEAAEKAIANPLLDGVSMKGAKGVIVSITGGEDMRLMEVDEAANHIRELVDPDANIIWGSAFNNELEGKIRVSVVATGIEAGILAQPTNEPSKLFSFPPRSRAEVRTPSSEAPPAAPEASVEAAPVVAAAPLAPQPVAEEEDELILGEPDAPVAVASPASVEELVADESAPIPSPRRWLRTERSEAPRAAAPAVAREGGTLFERMSSIARGSAKVGNDDDEEGSGSDPLDIPRFLNRQNNQ